MCMYVYVSHVYDTGKKEGEGTGKEQKDTQRTFSHMHMTQKQKGTLCQGDELRQEWGGLTGQCGGANVSKTHGVNWDQKSPRFVPELNR